MDWEDDGRKGKAFWLIVEGRIVQKLRRLGARVLRWDPYFGDIRPHDFAQGRTRSNRIALVNHMIRLKGYRSYLEIGVRQKSAMFEEILAPNRTSVDPDPAVEADHVMPSDAFFANNRDRFDIIFIDGNHNGDQVQRDLENALTWLSEGGVILLHDMNPPTRFHARRDYEVDGRFPSWNGTSWKGFVALRQSRADLSMCVVNTDWGVGIVHPGQQALYQGPCDSYDDLATNREEMLNLITVEDFLRRYSTAFAAVGDAR